jgi:large repetitive protein
VTTHGVASNEPVDGDVDGHTIPDWEVTGPLAVNLRAERSEAGDGRIYTIAVEGTDAAGNTTVRTLAVSVSVRQ